MATTAFTEAGKTATASADLLSRPATVVKDESFSRSGQRTDTGVTFATTSDQGSTARRSDVVTAVPRKRPTVKLPADGRKSFTSLARWEGSVLDVYSTYFVAEVIDLDNGEHATAEFDMAKVKPGDRPLCEPGALFYWSVGYEIKKSGQRVRASDLHFRRIGTAANRV